MKNLSEPRNTDDVAARPNADVVQFERRPIPERETTGTLLPETQVEEFRSRWAAIQTSFVDEPQQSVTAADKLVGAAIKQVEEVFFAHRANLEKQWSRGEEASTEELRVALQRYRDFFDRLLSLGR